MFVFPLAGYRHLPAYSVNLASYLLSTTINPLSGGKPDRIDTRYLVDILKIVENH